MKLSAFQDKLIEWIKPKTYWQSNVYQFTLHYLEEGLKDRAITRDMEWGIPIPLPGYENKRIYVWFEAVIGYLSASKEWAKIMEMRKNGAHSGEQESKSYYFIGKDNIVFHSIIWPAMLMGYGGLNLPYDVPANEFLTFEMKKFSKSRNWAVWLPDYLSRYAPDPLRYLLSINMPETTDTDFSWREYYRRNNDELVATYGNLAHRVLTFTYKNYDGSIPVPGPLDSQSQGLLDKAARNHRFGGGVNFPHAISGMPLKRPWDWRRKPIAISMIKRPGRQSNRIKPPPGPLYIQPSPYFSCLRTVFYPFLPFSSQKLHEYLGYSGNVQDSGWTFALPAGGQKLVIPQPLFVKLDEKMVEEENKNTN